MQDAHRTGADETTGGVGDGDVGSPARSRVPVAPADRRGCPGGVVGARAVVAAEVRRRLVRHRARARSSDSPGSSAAAAPRSPARCSAPIRQRDDPHESRRPRAIALAQGPHPRWHGAAAREPQGPGARDGAAGEREREHGPHRARWRPQGVRAGGRERGVVGEMMRRCRTLAPPARRCRCAPVGRQPAEGVTGEVAGEDATAADRRRADPGGRRRRQTRHLRADPRPCRRRDGGAPDLERARGGHRARPPRVRDAAADGSHSRSTVRTPTRTT